MKMRHCRVTFVPDNKAVDLRAGFTLLQAAEKAGIILSTPCGGNGACGKCAVIIATTSQKVLACQYIVDSDLTVEIPESSRFFTHQILEDSVDREFDFHHGIKKVLIALTAEAKTELLPKLDNKLKAKLDGLASEQITLVTKLNPENIDDYSIIDIELGDSGDLNFGIAIDIGTTTIVTKLIEVSTAKVLATASTQNPQAKYGADVIARINFGHEDKNLQTMHSLTIACINRLIQKLTAEAKVSEQNIYEVAIAGNTTMNHIFLGFPIKQLGQLPFKAHETKAQNITAKQLSIEINPLANIHTIANIAGFVGADTTAVTIAIGMENITDKTVIVDIGTNGEIVAGTKDKMYACSCAAGPAFEGAKISQGSHAISGAIQAVDITDGGADLELDIIGLPSTLPKTICGSGLIDVMATLLKLGIVDYTGRFVDKGSLNGKLTQTIIDRIVEIDGRPAFLLADNSSNEHENVYFTQQDVRETQLAKAAIAVGIKLLMDKLGIDNTQLAQLFLAGAFGFYIRQENAKAIGLIPNIDSNKIHFVGNAACSGAQLVLLSGKMRKLASKIAEQIEAVELATEPAFLDAYTDAMSF